MPPRFAYWTIIAGGLPTAFRAVDRDDLLPTFHRLREKHPDAVMQWFARGRLWSSPEEARTDRARQQPERGRRQGSTRDARSGRRSGAASADRREPARGPDWRPGGVHRDPRQKYVDAKKARNAARRRQRFEHKQGQPHDARARRGPNDWRPNHSRPKDSRPKDSRPKDSRPKDSRPKDSRPKDSRPKGSRPYDSRPHGWTHAPRTHPRPHEEPRAPGRRQLEQPAFTRGRGAGTPETRPPAPAHGAAGTDRERRRRRSETDD